MSNTRDPIDLIAPNLVIGSSAPDRQLVDARNHQIQQIARCFSGSSSVNECRSCGVMFKDGDTCPRGGCPMGGDF